MTIIVSQVRQLANKLIHKLHELSTQPSSSSMIFNVSQRIQAMSALARLRYHLMFSIV